MYVHNSILAARVCVYVYAVAVVRTAIAVICVLLRVCLCVMCIPAAGRNYRRIVRARERERASCALNGDGSG